MTTIAIDKERITNCSLLSTAPQTLRAVRLTCGAIDFTSLPQRVCRHFVKAHHISGLFGAVSDPMPEEPQEDKNDKG